MLLSMIFYLMQSFKVLVCYSANAEHYFHHTPYYSRGIKLSLLILVNFWVLKCPETLQIDTYIKLCMASIEVTKCYWFCLTNKWCIVWMHMGLVCGTIVVDILKHSISLGACCKKNMVFTVTTHCDTLPITTQISRTIN